MPSDTRREYIFTAYERLWHWVMALSVIALIVTGLQIHFPGRINLFGAASAVAIHNFFAVVLMINAFLALFYHLATAAIRQFLPEREGLAEELTRQTKYYFGISSKVCRRPSGALRNASSMSCSRSPISRC